MHLQVKNLFVPDNSRVTLLQFSCDKLKNEIMNEIVDKTELLLRADAGHSSLQMVLGLSSVRMNLFYSIVIKFSFLLDHQINELLLILNIFSNYGCLPQECIS